MFSKVYRYLTSKKVNIDRTKPPQERFCSIYAINKHFIMKDFTLCVTCKQGNNEMPFFTLEWNPPQSFKGFAISATNQYNIKTTDGLLFMTIVVLQAGDTDQNLKTRKIELFFHDVGMCCEFTKGQDGKKTYTFDTNGKMKMIV